MVQIYQKGQIVIPKYIRELFNLRKGDEVSVTVKEEKIIIEPTNKVLKEFNRLCAQADMTDKEVGEMIKKAEKKRLKRWMDVYRR